MAQQTEETVSVSFTREELELILGTFEDTEFSEDTEEEDEDEDGDTIEVEVKSESEIAQSIISKLNDARKSLG
jgi:hypothetical protein